MNGREANQNPAIDRQCACRRLIPMPSSLHEKPDPGALGAAGGSKGNHRSRCSWRRILGGIALILALTAAGCSQREEAGAIAEEAGQAQARGQTDLAISRWSSVLRLDKKNADAYLQRAALYGQRGESEKAIADYSQFLRFSVKKTAPQ